MRRANDLKETDHIARNFLQALYPKPSAATVVGLRGELGSGKTTFVKMIAAAYGVSDPVTSPTFVIEKIYKLEGRPFERIIHIDAYRLEGEKELEPLRWSELLADPGNLILVEWPEKVGAAMPKDAHYVSFTFIGDTSRDIDISYGEDR